MIKIPSFFFPTTVIILDDDKYFLQILKSYLQEDFRVQTFTDPREIKPFVSRQAVCMEQALFEYFPLSDESKIKAFVENGLSHHLVSVWVTDYQLEYTTGIEVLENLNPPYVQRVLMSNFVDQAVIDDAYKYKTINAYLPKLDHEFIEKLKNTIHEMQKQFFNNYCLKVNESFFKDSKPCDSAFANFFRKIAAKFGFFKTTKEKPDVKEEMQI